MTIDYKPEVAVLWSQKSGYLVLDQPDIPSLFEIIHGLEENLGYESVAILRGEDVTFPKVSTYVKQLDPKEKVDIKLQDILDYTLRK